MRMVRSARMMPPGPSVSAIVCSGAMTLTNLKIGHGAGFIAANLKGDHHEIRIL